MIDVVTGREGSFARKGQSLILVIGILFKDFKDYTGFPNYERHVFPADSNTISETLRLPILHPHNEHCCGILNHLYVSFGGWGCSSNSSWCSRVTISQVSVQLSVEILSRRRLFLLPFADGY